VHFGNVDRELYSSAKCCTERGRIIIPNKYCEKSFYRIRSLDLNDIKGYETSILIDFAILFYVPSSVIAVIVNS
jgi:hypothetical protein